MRITRTFCVAAAAIAALACGGCARPTVVLWTNQASVAHIVEEYNAAQDDYVVDLYYRAEPSVDLRLEESSPDIVIAPYIEDQSTSRFFSPLDRLVNSALVQQAYYPGLLESGRRAGRQLLLPLSFDLPLVLYTGNSPVGGDEIVLSPARMRAEAEQFNIGTESRWTNLGFSPRWDGAYLYEHLRLFGFSVRERSDGAPQWSEETLTAGLADVASWVEEVNGGIQRDLEFQERYLYDPFPQLVRKGRIRFAYDSAAHYFEQSDAYRSNLSYLWLGEAGRIEALESVVYAAIPARARNRRGAEQFMRWLFQETEQERLLVSAARKRITSFGLAGGFSSLVRVNERYLAAVYPNLAGRVPPAAWVHFPAASPRHWADLRSAVVKPWLLRQSAGTPQSRSLAESVRAWLLQQEE